MMPMFCVPGVPEPTEPSARWLLPATPKPYRPPLKPPAPEPSVRRGTGGVAGFEFMK